MLTTLKAIGLAVTLAAATVMVAACGPDDGYQNPAGTGAERGVGAGPGAGATTTVPRANPAP